MDAAQLQQQLRIYTEELAKNEHELQMLTNKLNDLKRNIPENKRKIETMKRDLLAQQALTKRKADAIQQSRDQQ